jgi:hypothetical protein
VKESLKEDPTKFKTHEQRKKKEINCYALKKISAMVMWYLPIIDHLRCLFANPEDAKLMSWHASYEHKNNGKPHHLANGN